MTNEHVFFCHLFRTREHKMEVEETTPTFLASFPVEEIINSTSNLEITKKRKHKPPEVIETETEDKKYEFSEKKVKPPSNIISGCVHFGISAGPYKNVSSLDQVYQVKSVMHVGDYFLELKPPVVIVAAGWCLQNSKSSECEVERIYRVLDAQHASVKEVVIPKTQIADSCEKLRLCPSCKKWLV